MSDTRVDILLALRSELKGSQESLRYLEDLGKKLLEVGAAYYTLEGLKRIGDLAVEIRKLSAEANLTTDAFQALKLGGLGFGVAQEDLVRGAYTLRHNLEDAAKNGASPLNKELALLHLSAAGLQALAPERQFEVIGRAIADAKDQNAAFTAGMDLLGSKSAPKLLAFLKELGAEGYDKFADAARKLTLTPGELETLDKAANAWERIAAAAKVTAARNVAGIVGSGVVQSFTTFGIKDDLERAKAELEIWRTDGNAIMIANWEKELARITAARAAREFDDPGIEAHARRVADAEARAKAALNEQMADAEAKAVSDAMDKQRRKTAQTVGGQEQKVVETIVAGMQKYGEESDAAMQKQAEGFRNLADPLRQYRLQLDQIGALKLQGVLTDQEAAAATKAVTQAMLEQSGAIGAHARALSLLQEAREKIEGNPFLGADQRQSLLGAILRDENAELDRQIALLRQKAQLSPNESRQLEGLVRRRTGNQFNPAGLSTGQQIGAELIGSANSFGTTAHQVAGILDNTIGRSVDAISQGLAGWVTGTTTWSQVLQQLEAGVVSDLIGGILHYGEQLLVNATIGRALQAAGAAESIGVATATATGISAAMIVPATLATIATVGGAAAQAPLSIAAAEAASLPLAFFGDGGFTTDGLNIAHPNEWVAPPWMVDHPVIGSVISGLESARVGGGSSSGSGGAAFAGKQPVIMVVNHNDKVKIEEITSNPRFVVAVQHIGRRDRGA